MNQAIISKGKIMYICSAMTRWFCDGFIMHHLQNLYPLPCVLLLVREASEGMWYILVVYIFVELIMILSWWPAQWKQNKYIGKRWVTECRQSRINGEQPLYFSVSYLAGSCEVQGSKTQDLVKVASPQAFCTGCHCTDALSFGKLPWRWWIHLRLL